MRTYPSGVFISVIVATEANKIDLLESDEENSRSGI